MLLSYTQSFYTQMLVTHVTPYIPTVILHTDVGDLMLLLT